MASPVIDVHTHCLTEAWFSLLKTHGGPRYSVKEVRGGLRAIHLDDAPFMTPVPAMFDYGLRLQTMDAHGVGALPYLISRMDQCFDHIPACREKIAERPSTYLSRIYADAVVFAPRVLELCVDTFGADNLLYGSDYPHTIGDMPGCLARVNALPGMARDKVRGRNAERIFSL